MNNRIVVDIGNSRIASAFFQDGKLAWSQQHNLDAVDLAASELTLEAQKEGGVPVAICSVVPVVGAVFVGRFRAEGVFVHEVTSQNQRLIKGVYESLGSDRIANVAAAFKLYAQDSPVLVLDFGTATTLTAVDQNAKFLGGWITLGLGQTFRSLYTAAEQLPELTPVNTLGHNALAFDTASAIRQGSMLAHAGIIERWVDTASAQLGGKPRVVATGGFAQLVAPMTRVIDVVNPELTLWGVQFIAEAAEDPMDQAPNSAPALHDR